MASEPLSVSLPLSSEGQSFDQAFVNPISSSAAYITCLSEGSATKGSLPTAPVEAMCRSFGRMPSLNLLDLINMPAMRLQ